MRTKDAWAAHSGDKCNVGTLVYVISGLVIYPQSRRESSYHHQYHHQSPRQSLNIPNIQPRVRACFVAALCPPKNGGTAVFLSGIRTCWGADTSNGSKPRLRVLWRKQILNGAYPHDLPGYKKLEVTSPSCDKRDHKNHKKGGNNDEHPQLRASLDMFRLLWSILLRFNGGAWIPDNVRAFCNARNSYRFCILCSAALGILLTFGFSCALFDKPLWTCDFQVAAMPCPSGVPVPLLREIQSDAPEKWMPKIIQSWRFWLGKPMLWGCLVYPYIWEKPIWSQQWSNHGA